MESVHSSGFQQRLDLAIDAVAELLRERTAKSGDLTYKGKLAKIPILTPDCISLTS